MPALMRQNLLTVVGALLVARIHIGEAPRQSWVSMVKTHTRWYPSASTMSCRTLAPSLRPKRTIARIPHDLHLDDVRASTCEAVPQLLLLHISGQPSHWDTHKHAAQLMSCLSTTVSMIRIYLASGITHRRAVAWSKRASAPGPWESTTGYWSACHQILDSRADSERGTHRLDWHHYMVQD